MCSLLSTVNELPPATHSDFKATPLGWAIHASENGWHRGKGDYTSTVDALIKAGAKPPDTIEGTEVVREVLRKYRTA